ncbi:hypothetical protein APTSU1_000498400 [Apodemus speciosus]|uniref:Uncharacterized protein n=1 Tax=Apodemus speciosus TaxID=105296 RepID=A0ABQ0ERU9_APOSI
MCVSAPCSFLVSSKAVGSPRTGIVVLVRNLCPLKEQERFNS